MKILYAAGEALPYIASGGLADVAGSLPGAINSEGHDCRVVIPLYADIPDKYKASLKFLTSFTVPVSWRNQYCGVFEGKANGVTYYLLDNEQYFKRMGLYGHYDDAERFTFFSRAVLEMLGHIDFAPDIINSNDWHTAMVPVFYKTLYAGRPGYGGIKTVFTIHNIQYQGVYGKELYNDVLGLPGHFDRLVDYDNCVNLMKGAIEASDAVSTVSPTYAEELKFPFYAYHLDPIIGSNAYKLRGILNGIDTGLYNPETDQSIFKNYSVDDPTPKAENKSRLQKFLGLPQDEEAMVIGMVGRLVEPKGIELLKFVLSDLMTDHVQLVLLGKGDYLYENYFSEIQRSYPGKLSVTIGFLQDLAHKIYAGSDVLLMPSKSEPCGLAQMVALRYGTVPVVRETGGLKDSVKDCGDGEGNGYTFKSFNAHDMLGALRRAEGAFALKEQWQDLVHYCMTCDFGWSRSAKEYIEMYKKTMG